MTKITVRETIARMKERNATASIDAYTRIGIGAIALLGLVASLTAMHGLDRLAFILPAVALSWVLYSLSEDYQDANQAIFLERRRDGSLNRVRENA